MDHHLGAATGLPEVSSSGGTRVFICSPHITIPMTEGILPIPDNGRGRSGRVITSAAAAAAAASAKKTRSRTTSIAALLNSRKTLYISAYLKNKSEVRQMMKRRHAAAMPLPKAPKRKRQDSSTPLCVRLISSLSNIFIVEFEFHSFFSWSLPLHGAGGRTAGAADVVVHQPQRRTRRRRSSLSSPPPLDLHSVCSSLSQAAFRVQTREPRPRPSACLDRRVRLGLPGRLPRHATPQSGGAQAFLLTAIHFKCIIY